MKKIEIFYIHYPPFIIDGNELFRDSAPNWSRYYPVIDGNLCLIALRSLLIKYENKLILVDTGFSENKEFQQIYHIKKFRSCDEILRIHGFNPEQITHVIHTHLHIDHCGGSFKLDKGKRRKPTFPFAQYFVSKKQLETALNPSIFEKDSFEPELIESFTKHHNLVIIENECFLFPWLELAFFHGHTAGLMLPVIHDKDQILFFAGDLIPTYIHLEQEMASNFDINPLRQLAERELFLETIINENHKIIFQHDNFLKEAKIKKQNNKYVLSD